MITEEVGTRIKILRKALHLTQAEFAKKIGLKGAAIWMYEKGQNKVTEQSLSLIARTYPVNEQWLRTGKGDMLIQYDNGDALEHFAKAEALSSEDVAFLQAFLNTPREERVGIFNFFRRFSEKSA